MSLNMYEKTGQFSEFRKLSCFNYWTSMVNAVLKLRTKMPQNPHGY